MHVRAWLALAAIAAANGPLTTVEPKGMKHHCEAIHGAPDRCSFARKYCSPNAAGMVDYITWYYCDMADAPAVGFSILAAWTALLFSTIGIASSDFFCPNLATIANNLGMSQSVAGVTFLAFGNGSPDVFSTFAAFKAHSGSLAIGELLGAAAFITSVVAGAMAIISPFKVSRRSFLRDAGFFLVAVMMTMFLLADGRLRLWESVLMIVFYVLYVAYVLLGTWIHGAQTKAKVNQSRVRGQYAAAGEEPRPDIDSEDDEARLLEHDIGALDHDSDEEAADLAESYIDINTSMSITGKAPHRTTNSVRPSLLGALEFRSLMSSDDGTSTGLPKRIRTRASSTVQPVRPRTLSSNTIPTLQPLSPSLSEIWNKGGAERRISLPMRTPSRASSRSDLETPVDEIASTSLRRQNPIEMLASVFPSPAGPSPAVPAVRISTPDGHEIEENPFAEAYKQSSESTSMAPLSPSQSYEAMGETERQPVPGIRPQPTMTDYAHDHRPKGTPWAPRHWPSRFLPPPVELRGLLFPTLTGFRTQSWTSRLLSILALPSVFVLTVTLPVVNPPVNQRAAERVEDLAEDLPVESSKDDADRITAHRGWNRWLMCVQCLLAPMLLVSTVYTGDSIWLPMLIALLMGLGGLAFTLTMTKAYQRPRFHSWLCFIGFIISVTWISTIANEVVGTLQAFGTILGISDAILGLTVFAVGNSLGDFVADVTVAKMGFSQMAISGVFGGPMLNILIGIGISGIYINLTKHHVYNTSISPTLIVSAASLLITLVVLLVAVPANNYVMSRSLGVLLCCIFLVGMMTSVLVELYL